MTSTNGAELEPNKQTTHEPLIDGLELRTNPPLINHLSIPTGTEPNTTSILLPDQRVGTVGDDTLTHLMGCLLTLEVRSRGGLTEDDRATVSYLIESITGMLEIKKRRSSLVDRMARFTVESSINRARNTAGVASIADKTVAAKRTPQRPANLKRFLQFFNL